MLALSQGISKKHQNHPKAAQTERLRCNEDRSTQNL